MHKRKVTSGKRPRLLIEDLKECSRVYESEYNAGDKAALIRMIVAALGQKRTLQATRSHHQPSLEAMQVR
jgi:hypothetical protein